MAGGGSGSVPSPGVSVPRPETPSPLCRTPLERTSTAQVMELVDLCTPPSDADTDKRSALDKRNLTRTLNKKANAAFIQEMKDSLAGGRPPSVNVPESATHLKARWHNAAKIAAYKLLDLRKESWKEYSNFDKERVHNEIHEHYKFDPPLDARRINKYLAGHLRSSRAVWKAHWQVHGNHNRHHNCPVEAWETLIKWWPTQACKDVAADMAQRRKFVQNKSKTGRKPLVQRLDDEVSLLHPMCSILKTQTSYNSLM